MFWVPQTIANVPEKLRSFDSWSKIYTILPPFKLSLQYIKYQESMYRSPTMSLHAIAFWENVKSPSNSYVESYLLPTENTKKKKKKKGKKGRKKKWRKKKKIKQKKGGLPHKGRQYEKGRTSSCWSGKSNIQLTMEYLKKIVFFSNCNLW